MRQDQEYSNDTMCRLLSLLESYFSRVGGKKFNKIFRSYDSFNAGKLKSIPELQKQILFQMDVYKNSHLHYTSEYNKKYDFPDNLSSKNIENYIRTWKNNISSDDFSQIYDYAFKIFKGDYNFSFAETIRNLEKNDPNANKVDPKMLMNYAPFIMNFIYSVMREHKYTFK
jgi:hypothetical protein